MWIRVRVPASALTTPKIIIKPKFKEHFSELTDFDKFIEYSLRPLRKSFRVNTLVANLKETKEELEKKSWNLKQIPWCKEGFFAQGNIGLGNTTEHFLGKIYIQEAASMIPPLALTPFKDKVLDVSASPGSKTTQIAATMKNKGLIIANDVDAKRCDILNQNLQRCSVSNCTITKINGFQIKGEFDNILLDAPCSGTGAIRKSPLTLNIWNKNMIKKFTNTQKKLIINNFNNLKPGGRMVYSTCSVEPEENEEIISYLLNQFNNAKCKKIDLNLKSSKPILNYKNKTYHEGVKNCLRLWPQDNDTEGFFIALITKD